MNNIKSFLETSLLNLEKVQITTWDLFTIVLALLLVFFVFRILRKVLKNQEQRGTIDEGKSYAILQITKYLLIVVVITYILDTIGIDPTIIIASSAALLVGVGLGIQHIFNDIISGFILLFGRPVSIGDVIEVDEEVGRVTEIGFRRSMIITRDDINMIIPNSKFVSEKVVNWSFKNRLTRFHLTLGVAYGSDTEKVRRILEEAAIEHPEVSKEKQPFARFLDFADSQLTFDLLFWSDNIFRIENILSDLRFSVDKKFRENNVRIPFPQQDVYIKETPDKK
ncbi:MAG: mechanosensitive ion channel [Bacteroidales bacterium]|nr:mechanosensitive ion channel [Bacteroidales bacterium]